VNILTFFRGKNPPRPQQRAAPAAPVIVQRAQSRAAAPAQRQPQQPAQHPQQGQQPQPSARHGYLAAHGVEKSFGGRMVVKNVTLYVRRGEAVGLLGPNGAGKTTVFYMITGDRKSVV